MTGYLQVVIEKARPYDAAAPVLRQLLDDLRADRILDLASGGGGPWPDLRILIRESEPPEVTLSDIAPSREARQRLEGTVGAGYEMEPVSALEVPRGRAPVWTMFTGLHHFSPNDVAALMRQAQEHRVGFAAFEATQRSVRGVLVTLLIPMLVWLLMPFVRPRRVLPLVFTYLPPVVPLLIWWDGLASTLRTYSVAELESIARDVAEAGYEWKVSELEVPKAPIPVLCLVGRPTGAVA